MKIIFAILYFIIRIIKEFLTPSTTNITIMPLVVFGRNEYHVHYHFANRTEVETAARTAQEHTPIIEQVSQTETKDTQHPNNHEPST